MSSKKRREVMPTAIINSRPTVSDARPARGKSNIDKQGNYLTLVIDISELGDRLGLGRDPAGAAAEVPSEAAGEKRKE